VAQLHAASCPAGSSSNCTEQPAQLRRHREWPRYACALAVSVGAPSPSPAQVLGAPTPAAPRNMLLPLFAVLFAGLAYYGARGSLANFVLSWESAFETHPA